MHRALVATVTAATVTLFALGACSTVVMPTDTPFASSPGGVPATSASSSIPTSAPTATTPTSAGARDFTTYLSGYGQVFTPANPPPDAADWHATVTELGYLPSGAAPESATYGTVTCVDPAMNCAERGLARPGERIDIWLVTFAEVPAAQACPLWATVDAHSGAFINGNGPPC